MAKSFLTILRNIWSSNEGRRQESTCGDPGPPNTPSTLVELSPQLDKRAARPRTSSAHSQTSQKSRSSSPSVARLSDRCGQGYPAYAKVLSNEHTFFMVRRFSQLNVRATLALQDEIVQLEEELNDRDDFNRRLPEDFDNGSLRNDRDVERIELIKDKIIPALTVYNTFVNSYTKLARHPIAEQRERSEVEKWFAAYPNAINDPERQYITKHDDLIAVLPQEKSWFRQMLEWTFVCKLSIFRRKLADEECATEMALSHHKRLERFSTAFIAVFGLGMLIGPLWILDAVKEAEKQLAVITAFIVLFFVVVAIATNAKVFESLAAAAAYSAVLMVFLQLGNPNATPRIAAPAS